jgi:hypothetical protein
VRQVWTGSFAPCLQDAGSRPEQHRHSQGARSWLGRLTKGAAHWRPPSIAGDRISHRSDTRLLVRGTIVRRASPTRSRARPMPLMAPIAASPQSNVLAGLATMVEVPPGSAPGPRGPALSSGRTAGSAAAADATAPGPRGPALSSGRTAGSAAALAAKAPGPRGPLRSSGRTMLDRSLNQGSALAIGAPAVVAATTTANPTRVTRPFEVRMSLLPS